MERWWKWFTFSYPQYDDNATEHIIEYGWKTFRLISSPLWNVFTSGWRYNQPNRIYISKSINLCARMCAYDWVCKKCIYSPYSVVLFCSALFSFWNMVVQYSFFCLFVRLFVSLLARVHIVYVIHFPIEFRTHTHVTLSIRIRDFDMWTVCSATKLSMRHRSHVGRLFCARDSYVKEDCHSW